MGQAPFCLTLCINGEHIWRLGDAQYSQRECAGAAEVAMFWETSDGTLKLLLYVGQLLRICRC